MYVYLFLKDSSVSLTFYNELQEVKHSKKKKKSMFNLS